MDVKAYISSGILELYAMDACTAAERAQVEEMVARHPEVALALASISATLEEYAGSFAEAPPYGLKGRILQAVQASEQEKPQPSAEKRSGPGVYLWLSVAATVLLAVSLVFNYALMRRSKQSEEQLLALQSEKSLMEQDRSALKANLEELKHYHLIASGRESRRVPLAPMPMAPEAKASVFWNPEKKEVFIEVHELAALPAGQQYQLWAIQGDKPVGLGVFDADMDGGMMVQMDPAAEASAFAVTIEKEGGSESPSMDKMVLMGTI